MITLRIPANVVTEVIEDNLGQHHSVYAKITEANGNHYGKPVIIQCTDDEVKELLVECEDRSRKDDWMDGFPWQAYKSLLTQIRKKHMG